MARNQLLRCVTVACLGLLGALSVNAQSFRVQCPQTTKLHPTRQVIDPATGLPTPDPAHPGFIKCQHVSGGDGFATMGDGQQIYLFGFGALSGRASLENQGGSDNVVNGPYAGTQLAGVFNQPYAGPITADGAASANPPGGSPDAAIRDPATMMNIGVMAASAPAPLIAVDEDDELFLTLSNVGMIMRPDLFEQHTIHWHGYPNASSYFDGVPDAS
ncbi:MAG: multicopper oxidase family protein, partial [Gammaproteobacteria bacterium]|nr:multicopper oxidase family protein [Gammaproteobacteria bacterium]